MAEWAAELWGVNVGPWWAVAPLGWGGRAIVMGRGVGCEVNDHY